MINRIITKKLIKVSKTFGVVSVTGPRQSGKTTLVKSVFPNHIYINLENLRDLDKVKSDPLSFINSIKNGVIIDEIQKFPELLSYIQISIDEDFVAGKFIITGSQNLLLLDKVSQSLAGRVAIIKLYPFSIEELAKEGLTTKSYIEQIQKGFYPAIYDKKQEPNTFYANYINTYVERDVRSIQNIGDLSVFTKFLQILASRIGQLLNLSDISSQLGVSHKTIDSWISVLEASYIIFTLEPYFNNYGKRIIKSPKVYFVDVGLAANLLRLDTPDEIENYYAIGGLFENLVILEIYKNILNNLSTSKLYFYRDKHGSEVDLLLDKGSKIEPIEIKSSSSFNSDFLKGIHYFNEISKSTTSTGTLIYTGETSWDIKNIKILNYKDLSAIKL
jgi:uncharacterized protein